MITIRNHKLQIIALLTLAEYCAMSPAQVCAIIAQGGK